MRRHAITGLLLGFVLGEPVNVPLRSSKSTPFGTQYDAAFANTNLAHDGTVNAYANGLLVQIYMDSYTSIEPVALDGKANISSFVSNSVSYLGLDGGTPANLTTFGGFTSEAYGDKTFNYDHTIFPIRDNETGTVAFWPAGAATTLPDNKTIVSFHDVLLRVDSHVEGIYNTLMSLTPVPVDQVEDGKFPPTGRPTPGPGSDTYWAFWFINEPSYGSFATAINQEQTFFYVFASDATGLKMARAPIDSYNTRSKYLYYNPQTSSYSGYTPPLNDTNTNIINFNSTAAGGKLNSGTIYWSNYHNTYVAIMLNDNFGRRVWTSYSTTGTMEGPWADIDYTNPLFTPYMDPRCDGHYNAYGVYNLHGYPSYDPSGKTLLVGGSGCAIWTNVDLIIFD